MTRPQPTHGRRDRPAPARLLLLLGLGALTLGACQIPRAKLHNLREVHSPTGGVRYRGNVQSDLAYALTRSLGSAPIRIEGLDGLGQADEVIEDPLEVDLENLVALARMHEDDPLVRGIQVEAFGWLAVDDQYVLGRERAVLGLGKQLADTGLDGPLRPPTSPAGPDELSPVLAGLARAGLGSLPAEVEAAVGSTETDSAVVGLAPAIASLRELELDRDGALRALAVVNILFERSDRLREGLAGAELRVLARELRREVVGQALFASLADEVPLVRAATVTALTRLPDGIEAELLEALVLDPSPEVSVEGLRHLAERGAPLGSDPLLVELERERWVSMLMSIVQIPEGRQAAFACAALSVVAETELESLRSEDWTNWWRRTRPDQPLPAAGA